MGQRTELTSQQTTLNGLPVRALYGAAEVELCGTWIDRHGDPADWSQGTRNAYANAIAQMRAMGTL